MAASAQACAARSCELTFSRAKASRHVSKTPGVNSYRERALLW